MVDEGTFKRNFSIFTENQFAEWNDWDNMVVIGGSIVASLLPIPGDIDPAKYFHEVY